MKKIISYMWIALAGALLLASCDKNEPKKFDDKNAFVAFDRPTVSVDEAIVKPSGNIVPDTAILRIPVTLASINGIEETVRFDVKDSTAKAGVNFELLTTSGTLSFDAKNRTRNIEFQILYYEEYTGDLKFTIELKKPETVALGYASVCTVTVGDVDHPLTPILGSYTASGTSYWYGPISWTMTIKKDKDDDHMVWIDNIFANAGWAGDDMMFYGNVDDDLTTIIFPFDQPTEYKYSYGEAFYLYGYSGGYVGDGSLNVTINKNDNGNVTGLTFDPNMGIWVMTFSDPEHENNVNLSIILPGITAVKN